MSENIPEDATVYKEIKRRADRLKMTISQLARISRVPRQTFHNWKQANPKPLDTYLSIDKALTEAERKAGILDDEETAQ